jgi:Flp pilus assembly protein TadG
MRIRRYRKGRPAAGQALMEFVLMVPILLMIVLNAINFAYFFLMALNITSAARSSGLYSIMGGATPASTPLPPAGSTTTTTSVSYIAYQDLTGAVYSPTTSNTGVQVCSPSVGAPSAAGVSQCSPFGLAASYPAADSDPECNSASSAKNPPCTGGAPAFSLNRVDVAYQFTPPIPLMPLNILTLLGPNCTSTGGVVTCTFYRHVEMRAMN